MIRIKGGGDPIEWGVAAKRAVAVPVTKSPKAVTKIVTENPPELSLRRGRGRPVTGNAASVAVRQAAYRARHKERLRAIGRASADLKRKLVAADG